MPTTDVAVHEPAGTDLALPGAALSLTEWAVEAKAALGLAEALCRTAFVPAHFRNKPEEAAAAILAGHEVGLSPVASLRSVYVISGTPAMYAMALRAVAQSRGHAIWVDTASSTRVVVKGRRKGTTEVVESEWTIDRATTAELGNNAQYKKNPQNMLTARATAEVCRIIAADALLGIPYAVEELYDPPVQATATVGPRVTAADIIGQAADQPEPAALAEPERVEVGPSQAQMKRMFAMLKAGGLADKELGLEFIRQTIGHDIASRSELTRAEVDAICNKLEELALRDPEASAE